MFEKLKEYALYIILGLIALGALAYAYMNTVNSKKGADIEEANFDAIVLSNSKSDKLKKNSTIANDLLQANGGKTIGKYKIDDSKVSYIIGETYSDIFDNKQMIDISADVADTEDGQLRTILIAQPAVSVNGDDTINTVNLNSNQSLTIGENTITKDNLKDVADELKGYNVGAIGYTTFDTEQEAKDFRDTYFSSYEIYEIGTTGKFAILTEYNQGLGDSNVSEKIDTTSNVTGLGSTGGEEVITWNLWEETKVNESTSGSSGVIASKYGKLIRPGYVFGGGNGNYTISEQDGYDVFRSNQNHGNIRIGVSPSNFEELKSYGKMKVVYDYINFNNDLTYYCNSIHIGVVEIGKCANNVANPGFYGGGEFNFNTAYSGELIVDFEDEEYSYTFKLKEINGDGIINFSGSGTYADNWGKELSGRYMINGGGYFLGGTVTDWYGGQVVMGNFHVYVKG